LKDLTKHQVKQPFLLLILKKKPLYTLNANIRA
jgi:hypothetical protein